jgi:hypothetical protein
MTILRARVLRLVLEPENGGEDHDGIHSSHFLSPAQVAVPAPIHFRPQDQGRRSKTRVGRFRQVVEKKAEINFEKLWTENPGVYVFNKQQ